MKKCKNCGKVFDDEFNSCPKCGSEKTDTINKYGVAPEEDDYSPVGIAVAELKEQLNTTKRRFKIFLFVGWLILVAVITGAVLYIYQEKISAAEEAIRKFEKLAQDVEGYSKSVKSSAENAEKDAYETKEIINSLKGSSSNLYRKIMTDAVEATLSNVKEAKKRVADVVAKVNEYVEPRKTSEAEPKQEVPQDELEKETSAETKSEEGMPDNSSAEVESPIVAKINLFKKAKKVAKLLEKSADILSEAKLAEELARQAKSNSEKNKSLVDNLQQDENYKFKIEGDNQRLTDENGKLSRTNGELSRTNEELSDRNSKQGREIQNLKSQISKLNRELAESTYGYDLEWSSRASEKMNWDRAFYYCSHSGDNWRLPTSDELNSYCAGGFCKDGWYWSSSVASCNSNSARDSTENKSQCSSKTDKDFVFCVRQR